MKKVLSIILVAVLCLSLSPVINASDVFDADIAIEAITDGAQFYCYAEMENISDLGGDVLMTTAVYNKNNEQISVEKEKIELKKGESESKTIDVLYNGALGEKVKVFFWNAQTLAPLREAVSSEEVPFGPMGESEKIEITSSMVFASSEAQANHRVTTAADGDFDTYWTARDVARDNPQSVTAVLDYVHKITKVGIAFGMGAERQYVFEVYTSLDGKNYNKVLDETTSELTSDVQYFNVIGSMAKFVKFAVVERVASDDPNNWIQIAEIEAYGEIQPVDLGEEVELYSFSDAAGTRLEWDSNPNIANGWLERRMTEETFTDYTPTVGSDLYVDVNQLPEEAGYGANETALHLYDNVDRGGNTTNLLTVSEITASQTPESGNVAKNVLDSNTSTKWTAEAVSETATATITMKFEDGAYIDTLKMAFGAGERGYKFNAAVSSDGVEYKTVIAKTTAQKDDKVHDYTFNRTAAKYLRLTFYGREDVEEGWIQVTEARPCDSKMEIEGAGGVMSAKQYPTAADRGKYSLSFNMFIPSVMENGRETNTFMSGITIADNMVSGGADLAGYSAIQIRFEEAGDNKVRLKKITSNQFNEGSLLDFMSTTFEKDKMWDVTIDVDPKARRTDVTVSDGINTEKAPLYYSYNNAEKTRASYWGGLEAKWILFNTGAGARSEMYVDNFKVVHYPEEDEVEVNEYTLAHYDMSEENSGNLSTIALGDNVAGEFEASLGEMLYSEIAEAPSFAGMNGETLHLYDAVGRETNATNGAGGVITYMDIPVPQNNNAYKVEFEIYAPYVGDYAGFSLGSGRDDVNCYGIQLRYMNNEDGLQLNTYGGNGFNKGDFNALLGSYTALTNDRPWRISITINPAAYKGELVINDGIKTETRSLSISTSVESWANRKMDTLSFNTGIGGFADMYIDNVVVTDLGTCGEFKEAAHGIVRLEATSGTGNYMHHQGNEISDFAEKQDPNYTRFVERSGLIDSDGVSFEVMNRPGYFLTIVPGEDNTLQVQPYSDTARFKANATFYKMNGNIDPKGFGKSTVTYASYRDTNRYLYNNNGSTVVWKRHSRERTVFYLRSEAQENRVSDSFKGNSLDKGKWNPQYPWGDHHNHYGLCRESAIEVKDGNVYLKANKISGSDWPKDDDGDTGINLDSFGFGLGGWQSYKAYVGVLSLRDAYGKNKFWRQSYMEGTFKQPDAGYGYWTAFWLSGANFWPPETDIFEYLSSSGSAGAHGWFTNMHWSGPAQGNWYSGSNLRTQYHRYALDWGYNYMDLYYDGQHFKRYTGDIVNYQNSAGGMVLIINNGIGGWESSLPSEYGKSLSMEWFRSYQY